MSRGVEPRTAWAGEALRAACGAAMAACLEQCVHQRCHARSTLREEMAWQLWVVGECLHKSIGQSRVLYCANRHSERVQQLRRHAHLRRNPGLLWSCTACVAHLNVSAAVQPVLDSARLSACTRYQQIARVSGVTRVRDQWHPERSAHRSAALIRTSPRPGKPVRQRRIWSCRAACVRHAEREARCSR